MQNTGDQTKSVYRRYDIVDEADLMAVLGGLDPLGHTALCNLGKPSFRQSLATSRRPEIVISLPGQLEIVFRTVGVSRGDVNQPWRHVAQV